MHITIECFGASQRWCGAEQIDLEMKEPATVQMAIALLAQRFPDFASRKTSIAIAIGNSVVDHERVLVAGERLALIPPVSGG